MGLAVSVYNNIKLVNEWDDYDFMAYVTHNSWEYKIKNLVNGGFYKGDEISCNISYPYSAHNRFRELLLVIINRVDLLTDKGEINWYALDENIPFYEFIDFSDCEGCLDFEVSKKLYKEFESWKLKTEDICTSYQFDRYMDWLNVFKLAKDNGVVVFG